MTSKPRPSSPSVVSLSWLHSDAADADRADVDADDPPCDSSFLLNADEVPPYILLMSFEQEFKS